MREGRRIKIIPVHCVRQELLNGGGFAAPAEGLARTHVWTAVPHASSGSSCKWCTLPAGIYGNDNVHHLWFVAIITRLRNASTIKRCGDIEWDKVARWSPPLTVYSAFPLCAGAPRFTWPEPDPNSRDGPQEIPYTLN